MDHIISDQIYPLYYGGPLEKDSVFFIHKFKNIPGSEEIIPGIYFGGDIRMVIEGINKYKILPKDIKFVVGCYNWTVQVLRSEIILNTWIPSKIKKEYIFDTHDNSLEFEETTMISESNIWSQALGELGGNYSVISQIPEFINLN